MKKLTILFLFITQYAHSQGIGIGSTNPPDPSAALDVNSTTKGFLVPRMTTAQRNAIASPSIGLQVFDTITNSFWYYNGTAWTNVYVGNFSLPFSGTGTSSNPLFSITNSSGRGILGQSTSSTGVKGESSLGIGIYGASNSGFGGYFENSSTSRTLFVINYGTGGAARFIGNVEMNDNLDVEGSITVDNGKGIVRSNTTTQQKVVRTSFNIGYTIGAFSTVITGDIPFESFSGIPTVYIGNVDSQTGEYYKVIITPVAVTANTVRFRFYNASDTSSTFSGIWNIVAIGPE